MTTLEYLDTTLRDGSHAIDHQFTAADCSTIVSRLAQAGVRYIEVGHGAGLGGSTVLQGFGRTSNPDLFDAAAAVRGDAELMTLLVPGFAVMDDLREAIDHGITGVRVATHVTEADVGLEHIELSREMGLTTHGFLMMTHMGHPDEVAEQAALMEKAGAEVVTVADSAGFMLPSDFRDRITAVAGALDHARIGAHAHNNLGLAIGNSLAAIEAGASFVDGSTGGLGAGAGNAIGEALIAALDKMGYETGVDAFGLMDLAADVVDKVRTAPQVVDRSSVVIGMTGVYSSFLRKAEAVGSKYGIDPRVLLLTAGERKAVAGQEDLLEQIALEMQAG